jgi:hypothetical protein
VDEAFPARQGVLEFAGRYERRGAGGNDFQLRERIGAYLKHSAGVRELVDEDGI